MYCEIKRSELNTRTYFTCLTRANSFLVTDWPRSNSLTRDKNSWPYHPIGLSSNGRTSKLKACQSTSSPLLEAAPIRLLWSLPSHASMTLRSVLNSHWVLLSWSRKERFQSSSWIHSQVTLSSWTLFKIPAPGPGFRLFLMAEPKQPNRYS